MKNMTRRQFLSFGGTGLAALALAACSSPTNTPTPTGSPAALDAGFTPTSPPRATRPSAGATAGSGFAADVEIALTAVPATVPILAGRPTQVWMLQGEVLKGDPAILQTLPNTYLGPIFRLQKNQRVRIRFSSQIPQETIIHWHGLHVPAEMDGHPRFVINQGETYTYEFEVLNRAGTYWYHPHPHGITGPQVYAGMAGFFLVSDEEEQAAGLPAGEFDIPLVIQDRTFDSNNQLVYLANGMMDQMQGFFGERILVNGQPDFTLPVATRPYRLRLLNGSNSRIYKLAWDDGAPLTVIGNDGGLLEKPVQRPYITLAPAERVELWVDFSDRPVGSQMVLQNQPFIAPAETMGGGMMGGSSAASPITQACSFTTATSSSTKTWA